MRASLADAALQAGDVLTWDQYPYSREFVKKRWVVILAVIDAGSEPGLVCMCVSGTTQKDHYDIHGKRRKHAFIQIRGTDIFPFIEETVLDFSTDRVSIPLNQVKAAKSSIEVMGRLSRSNRIRLADKIRTLTMYAKKVKEEAYRQLHED